MNSKKIFLVSFLCCCLNVFSQKFELGKVSVKELEQKAYPQDTTAAAAILYNKGRSYFVYRNKEGFSLVHEYEFRIKIYKKEGLKWADFKVPYYIGYESLEEDRISFSDAVTYNLENGQIVKTKLNSEGRFKKDLNEFWGEASISLPNVKPGSVIEFKYTLKSQDIVEFPTFNFQYEIPVSHSEYSTEIPQFFIYKPTLIGFSSVKSDAKVVNGYQNYFNELNQSVNLTYQQIKSSYVAENLPALKAEPYVDNIENYRSSIRHELEKTVFPDAPEKNYAATWEGVALSIFKDKRFGNELKERAYFEPFFDPVIKNATTETEKAVAIFEYVKRTMHWNEQYGYYTKKGVKKAFDEKTGNIAEINFILIAMLNRAGFNASPVLLSTVSHGVPVFPNRTVFNYVIAAIEIDGKQILLDATDPYATLNILPLRDLNWTGRLIKSDGSSKEIALVPATASKKTINIVAKMDAKAAVTGKLRTIRTDYSALSFREKYATQNKEQYVEKLENEYGDAQISEYSSDNSADLSKAVTEAFAFATGNASEFIGDKIFVSPMLFFTEQQNPFVLETRDLPIYYGYPFQIKYNISLEIPDGYAVESLPKSGRITTGENLGNFSFNAISAENKVQISVTQEINSAIVSGNFYEPLKEFYKKMIEKENEKIILKKI